MLCIPNKCMFCFIFRTKDYILKAVRGDASFNPTDFTKFSHNYKIDVPLVGSVESNMIFDSANYMPREVMLATTLDNFDAEILEVLYDFIIKRLYALYVVSLFQFFNALDDFFLRLVLKVKALSRPLKFSLGKTVSSLIPSRKPCTGSTKRFHIPLKGFWISGFPH